MIILIRTLQVTGWFEVHKGKSPAEYIRWHYQGSYSLEEAGDSKRIRKMIDISNKSDSTDSPWLRIHFDSTLRYEVKTSDFEDEQVLLELYEIDSIGGVTRLEGCELVLSMDDSDFYSGTTIGDFCGLKDDSPEYLGLLLELNNSGASLRVESRTVGDSTARGIREYLLERIDSQ